MTYTYAILEVSPAVYGEVQGKLLEAGYRDAIREGVIDMHGIALRASAALEPKLADVEREVILQTLKATNGKLAEAARQLGVSRTTLWRRLKRYGVSSGGRVIDLMAALRESLKGGA